MRDNNGGILPSGLFWTVDLAQGKLNVSENGRRVRFKVVTPAIETYVIFGPNDTPSTVEYEVELRALGDRVTRGKGTDVPPTDPGAFIGRFFDAAGAGRYAGSELGFAFETVRPVTTQGTFAEFGHERNGVFL